MNTNLHIYIVEDEPLITATIETVLKKQGYTVVGTSDNYSDALNEINSLKPNLVLLDIQLQGEKDGIALALELDNLKMPYLYLTSQTDPETINRVKQTKPLGYIVKPFTESGLRSNIQLAWHNFSLTNNKYFLVKKDKRIIKLDQNDILYLKAFDNYCYVNTKNEQYLIPHTLKYAYEQLNNTLFVRTHRSYVVNCNAIKVIEKDCVLINEIKIPLSSSQKMLL